MLYFDARCSHRYPTVEVRVTDVCLDVRDTVLVAALVRALVETSAQEWAAGAPPPPSPPGTGGGLVVPAAAAFVDDLRDGAGAQVAGEPYLGDPFQLVLPGAHRAPPRGGCRRRTAG